MTHIGKIFLFCVHRWMKDNNWRQRNTKYFLSYCRYAIKYIISWKLLRIPLHFENLLKFKLHFFHYSIFLSLFEDMFLNDEYYVKLPKNPHIIDLGSEVGLSVCYFKSIYPNAKIDAFEPDSASYKLLTENIQKNNIKKIATHNVAVADKTGGIPFFIDPVVDGSLTMSLYPKRQQKKIRVKVDRLSRYIRQKVDLLKIDIEGAELDVLTDLYRSKKIALIDHIIIEYHHHINANENHLSRLLALLENAKFGYQIQAKYNPPFQKHHYQDFLIFVYKENNITR